MSGALAPWPIIPRPRPSDTLEALQRNHLRGQQALNPPRQSTLIALLADATAEEREAIICELEERNKDADHD